MTNILYTSLLSTHTVHTYLKACQKSVRPLSSPSSTHSPPSLCSDKILGSLTQTALWQRGYLGCWNSSIEQRVRNKVGGPNCSDRLTKFGRTLFVLGDVTFVGATDPLPLAILALICAGWGVEMVWCLNEIVRGSFLKEMNVKWFCIWHLAQEKEFSAVEFYCLWY